MVRARLPPRRVAPGMVESSPDFALDELAQADQRIAVGSVRIADQLMLIERIRQRNGDVAAPARMLGQMQEALRRWRARRERILLRRELENEA